MGWGEGCGWKRRRKSGEEWGSKGDVGGREGVIGLRREDYIYLRCDFAIGSVHVLSILMDINVDTGFRKSL